ncbi:actin remodeling regulator NHS isoform X2 [Ictalurus punctatus]|uniref:Actin remodeling regulator NHS isoform X2 n=1 Tax=Ictalurus punctatus TaxID=7998 RepID=A0A2D0SHK8_ICTPU|nr:actin remodeling regulator NHS isoform X2 [Ictalurus punctatus]
MPFAKRTVEPQRLCRSADPGEDGSAPPLMDDLCAVSNAALSRTVRQLSDVARHAGSLFHELERELASTDRRLRDLREKVRRMERSTEELDPKQEAVPVSSLDVEVKLSEHFQSAWQLHRNVFVPSSRPPCVEELHQNAKQSLRALHRDQQQRQEVSERERRVTLLIAPPTPTSPSHHTHHTFESIRSSSPTECCHFSRRIRQVDSDPDSVSLGHRSRFPIPNVPSPLDTQTNWSVALPLPTPEDRMKSQSQAIVSCVVPIDVTGAGFDRDASVRCSLAYSQSVLQRRRKLRRRKTITGIPRQVQQDLDSDESPVASQQAVIVHSRPEACQEDLTLTRHSTRDSGCQTEDFLVAVAAPSRRRTRAQRGQSATFPLSHSTGNIPSLPDSSDNMFTTSIGSHLRSHSLPREGVRLLDEVRINSDNDDGEEDGDLSAFEGEEFLPLPGENMLKDEEESTDDQVQPERQLGSFNQHPESPEHVWKQRGRSRLPCKTDEISSSSDTFSSPIRSNAGVLASQMDHKEDHQSSSGNWSGSSSTCPSQTSETIPPAASPPLTHCDSELSLNTALNITEDSAEPYSGDGLQGLRGHQTGSFASTAIDMLDDAGVITPSEADWSYPQHRSCNKDYSPESSREGEGSLECPSFVSIATIESLDKPPSDKADTMSHFSVDAEGYYTSMHFDCGLKGSKSFTYNYASVDQQKEEYRGPASNGRRSLSLRKPKVKPSPPERCSSLKKISSQAGLAPETSEPKILNEQKLLMSSKERNSPLASSDPSDQPEDKELVEAWGGQIANQIPDVALLGSADRLSLKNEDAVQSVYADLWLVNDLKSNDNYRSLSNSSTATGTTVIECMKSHESFESHSGSRASTPLLPSVEAEFRLPSPEKLVNLASPSSGYSSQSETPTSSSAFFPNPNPLSPIGGKRKPKVPERKSSLTSMQKRTSKKDLELPIIPPTHLDLSALHNGKKALSHRNHVHILNKNKHKVAVATTESVEPGSNSPLEITPMMLHSVQLRSVSKSGEENHDPPCTDASTRPKRPTVSNLNETRKPPPYRSLTNESLSQDNCESMFTPTDGPEFGSLPRISFTKNRFDRIALSPLWSTTAFSATSEQVSLDDMTADVSESQKVPAEPEGLFPQSSMETEKDQEARLEPTDENPKTESPSGHDGTLCTRSEKFEQVPDLILHSSLESLEMDPISDASNHREESLSSGGPTRSASQETMGEVSTPDTEDYFSKESTPSEPVVSPLTDESTTEDDSVFLSPTNARTTEDLFAMIHRSKRKVLGRKDSKGDTAVRSSLGATFASPATSPSTPVTPTSSQRAPSQIYRSVKKSNTSNEEFKQLLLKRGSRSDSSFRISATEILKSPVASRTFCDPLSEGAKHPEGFPSPFQPQSSEKTPEVLHSPYPKANVEGFSTKVFSSSRQGRSRLPPAANSSRYSTRSRLYTTPMQAISEGETENSDGSPHDDRSS